MGKRKTTLIECDNPNCATAYEYDKNDPAIGYHLGKGVQHAGGGGWPIPEVYACRKECIELAVLAAIDLSLGYDPVTGDRFE